MRSHLLPRVTLLAGLSLILTSCSLRSHPGTATSDRSALKTSNDDRAYNAFAAQDIDSTSAELSHLDSGALLDFQHRVATSPCPQSDEMYSEFIWSAYQKEMMSLARDANDSSLVSLTAAIKTDMFRRASMYQQYAQNAEQISTYQTEADTAQTEMYAAQMEGKGAEGMRAPGAQEVHYLQLSRDALLRQKTLLEQMGTYGSAPSYQQAPQIESNAIAMPSRTSSPEQSAPEFTMRTKAGGGATPDLRQFR